MTLTATQKTKHRNIRPIGYPDSFHLKAAEGWLELGSHKEAYLELEKVAARLRVHPYVLELRWRIYAQARNWRMCLQIAQGLCALTPGSPVGWIHLSYALHELGRTQEAWENLSAAAEKFPRLSPLLYNLACYSFQLGRSGDAMRLLRKAFDCGDSKALRAMALKDPDLRPLWSKIA
jgi:tetratricopeptide (TPR) repeat protein